MLALLDEKKSAQYLRDCLESGRTLSGLVARSIDYSQYLSFILLPDKYQSRVEDINLIFGQDLLQQYEDFHQRAEIVRIVGRLFGGSAENMLLTESVVADKEDPCVQRKSSDLVFINDGVIGIARNPGDPAQVDAAIITGSSASIGNGFVIGDAALKESVTNRMDISNDQLDRIVRGIRGVLTRALDSETWVISLPRSSAVQLIGAGPPAKFYP